MTSRTEAAAAFTPLLERLTPFDDHESQWPQVRVRVRCYAEPLDVPDIMVSSVRAVVFKGPRVVVVREHDGTCHAMPGGRREPGESLEKTVRRELLEECGWHIGPLRPFAVLHFQHLGERPPPSFEFEWCDFANLCYLADGVRYERGALDRTQGEVGSRLMSFKAARAALSPRHGPILEAALAARRREADDGR